MDYLPLYNFPRCSFGVVERMSLLPHQDTICHIGIESTFSTRLSGFIRKLVSSL